jgi:tetratricopeptide (TPR) repeat protein
MKTAQGVSHSMIRKSCFVRFCTVFFILFLIGGCAGVKPKPQPEAGSGQYCSGGQCVDQSIVRIYPKEQIRTGEKQVPTTFNGLTAAEWFKKAVALWNGKKYSNPGKAVEYLANAIGLKPDYADAYYSRGFAYYELGKYKAAVRDYDKAVSLHPDDAMTYNNRGKAYAKLRKYNQAINDFNEAIRLQPSDVNAYNNRAFAYLLQGNKKSGCLDARTACNMGLCIVIKWAQRKGYCP